MQARIATKGGFDEIGDGNRVLGQGLLHGLPEWYPEDVPGERDSPAECDDFRIDESREICELDAESDGCGGEDSASCRVPRLGGQSHRTCG